MVTILPWSGLGLAAFGCWAAAALTPASDGHGGTVHILYTHGPAAWLGMGSGIAVASVIPLVWRHPPARVAVPCLVAA